jgi:hypothetical protein
MKSFSLSIDKPCDEKWENLRPTAQGRYCTQCSKVVIDFTKMNDEQIIQHFKSLPQNTCGRFLPEQLTSYTISQGATNRRRLTVMYGTLITCMMTFFVRQGIATSLKKEIKTENHQQWVWPDQTTKSSDTIRVGGQVKLVSDNSVLPGVNVKVKGRDVNTVTNENGEFKFSTALNAGDILVFDFIGLITQEYVVSSEKEITILMAEDTVSLNEKVVVGGICATRTISFRRWWWSLKRIF